ncbi:glycosyltransferase family 4 protein [Paenibacillus protaetiae]|uniref:Glycosyltransferase family 4 protein n=1 Tax=Paenibacillus protaetiae TaxID=2509456 RepID=A0A4P6F8S2_9BACL|nr:glycosyltransferase family 4 protein [Paenibacillus protaetiae]QAY66848.1 glycosyltransferase family 4 protein [Paenibacillus protaetiae]
MRIVVVAPNTTILPPPKDGGTERVVYELSEQYAKRGHDVFLYGRGGSRSSGTLFSYPFDGFGDAEIRRFVEHTLPPDVDIIHDHTFESAVSSLELDIPVISTRHIPRQTSASHPVYVSRDALMSIGGGNGIYIHNGLVPEHYDFRTQKQNYLLFMGRIVPEKGVSEAIDIAEKTNSQLIIAGPIHNAGYFNTRIKPRLRKNKITYVGPVGAQQRQDLLSNARCLLFPIQWREPFGLVMIEALACGTPVLALNRGAAAEVLNGLPDFVCHSLKEMERKVANVHLRHAPAQLREYVVHNFNQNSTADQYIQYFNEVIAQKA